MAGRPSWLHHDTRGGQPRQQSRLRTELEVLHVIVVPTAVPHATVLLRQRLPGLQGCTSVECPQLGTADVEEAEGTDHSHRYLLATV